MCSDQVVYGHSRPNRPFSEWESLFTHLRRVAGGFSHDTPGSTGFADAFGAPEWGRLAGLWHDIGKYAEAFQLYIRNTSDEARHSARGPDHSTAGAQLAKEIFGNDGLLIAYAIAGHHAGLPDWSDPNGGRSGLKHRLEKNAPEIADALSRLPDWVRDQPTLKTPGPFVGRAPDMTDPGLRVAMFVRMLFSCLVDADFLATEFFCNRDKAGQRPAPPPPIDQLLDALNRKLSHLVANTPSSPVNDQRADLLKACRARAQDTPGLFSLTAPTGAGKTFSSLAFALEHAKRHGLRRVIYALPFMSVTEQIAAEFREVFKDLGDNIVLEHHSAAAWKSDDEDQPKTLRTHLAAENWDAPIVVTTNVQLLESLFASRTGACRKLHRIAGSVVILDEAQALPVHLLRPTLTALDELAQGYGVSVVLCSATMPALTHRDGFKIGLKNVREIAPDPDKMADAMRRVRVTRPGLWTDEQLVEQLAEQRQTLAIVNTKGHAAGVFSELRDRVEPEGVFHLSAAMCPAHRSDVLEIIKARLKTDEPCRVISTQVIEAGVDIDFPVVFRAMAGLDSIAQAAGRCNREGRLDTGEVIVFDTDRKPSSMVRLQAQTGAEVAKLHDDLLSLEAVEQYFRLHFWSQKSRWDKHGIASREMFDVQGFVFQFRAASEKYRVIEQQTTPIVVPYGKDGQRICDELLASEFPDRRLLRKTQRYTVSVYEHQLAALLGGGACEYVHDQILVLINNNVYHKQLGLDPKAATDTAEWLASC